MSSRRDPDLLIKAFLDEGMNELPDRSFDAVRTALDQTRQWAVFGPWKEPQIMTATRFALIAVAIAVVAIVAIRFLPSTSTGPASTPTPTVAPTPSPSPIPVPSGSAVLTPGRYVIDDPAVTVTPVSFTLPAGWSTDGASITKGGKPGDVFTSTVIFSPWKVDHVYGDECFWSGTLKQTDTAAQVVDALESQTRAHMPLGSSVVPAKPATIDGLSGQLVELSRPDSLDVPGCEMFLRLWPDPGPDESGGWRQVQGQTDKVYVFDVNSEPLLIVATYLSTANPSDLAELQSIVDSVQIQR